MHTAVRRAEQGEGEQLHELAVATFVLACPPGSQQVDIDAFIRDHLSADRFEEYLADPDRELLVAVQGDHFVGYTMLVFGAPTDQDVAAVVTARPTAELSKVYVLADQHGSGVAAALMTTTIEIATLRGARTLWLGVNQENARANRFYEKNGFQKVGAKRFRLGDNWEQDFTRERVLGPSAWPHSIQ